MSTVKNHSMVLQTDNKIDTGRIGLQKDAIGGFYFISPRGIIFQRGLLSTGFTATSLLGISFSHSSKPLEASETFAPFLARSMPSWC